MSAAAVERDTHFGTYRVVGLPPVDFDRFHREELPRRLRSGVNEQVAWDVRGRAPIAISLPDGRAYSYACLGDRVEVRPGVASDAETALEIVDEESWIDYVYEFRTRYGLLYSNAVRFARGSFDSWDAWEPAIRCMYSGRPIYAPRALEFRDRRGAPLDLRRSFAVDDDPEEMSHFLRLTGWLVVKRAFEPAQVDELAREVERIRAAAVEGELRSWWAADPQGRRFPYRLTYLCQQSAAIAELYETPRVKQLVALSREDVVPVPDRIEGVLAVVKDFATGDDVSAFANLPFHTDCGFGGCHLTCPCVLVGVQLDGMSERSSQLQMIAGSWGKAYHNRPGEMTPDRYPIVALETEPGDATVHYGCGLHAGPGPTGPGRRRTLYLQHYSPRTFGLIGPFQGYNQIMPGYGQGQIRNLVEVQAEQRAARS